MEPENINATPGQSSSVWTTVTPLSKYLAMALFVALPFIGGWVGYTFAPEKVVEVDRAIVQTEDATSLEKNKVVDSQPLLLEDFSIKSVETGKMEMSWKAANDLADTFSPDKTYITFRVVPANTEIEKSNEAPNRVIGDGFLLAKNSYSFEPAYYEDNLWEEPLQKGEQYRVVAELVYQPTSTGCDPQYAEGKDCRPLYSESDAHLIEKAGEYMYVSEPISFR